MERAAHGFVFYRFAQSSNRIDSLPPISLLICRDGEASRKNRFDSRATDRAAAAFAASARAGVASGVGFWRFIRLASERQAFRFGSLRRRDAFANTRDGPAPRNVQTPPDLFSGACVVGSTEKS
jgi:hypothetical protein